MSSAIGDLTQAETAAEYRTMDLPCVVGLTTVALDDDGPRLGTVRWQIVPYFGLRLGRAVAFECPRGHTSKDDPDLLKAYRARRF